MNKIAYLFVLLGLAGCSRGMSESGTYPAEPFNGMQLTYRISGVRATDASDKDGFTSIRFLEGDVTGSSVVVEGAASMASGSYADLEVTVTAGSVSDVFKARIETPQEGVRTKDYRASVKIPTGVQRVSVRVALDGSYSMGFGKSGTVFQRGLVLQGDFAVGRTDSREEPSADFMARGMAALEAGKVLDALDDFDSALSEIEKKQAASGLAAHEVLFQRSRALMEWGHYAAARSDLDAAIQQTQDRPGYYFLRAKLACLQGDSDQAALDLCKGCEMGGVPDGDLMLDVQLQMAEAAEFEREALAMDSPPIRIAPVFQEELPLIEALQDSDTQAARNRLADLRYVRAIDLMEHAAETGREREEVLALSYARSAAELSGRPRDYFLLGSMHALREDLRSDLLGEQAFLKAAEDRELAPVSDLARGQLLLKQAAYRGAAEAMERAVRAKPDLLTAEIIQSLLLSYTMADMAAPGIKAFTVLESTASTAPECRIARAILVRHEGRTREAEKLLDGLKHVQGCGDRHLEGARALLQAWNEEEEQR